MYKWMIASDIHGSAYYCRKLLERFDEEKADRLLLLGDLLYHGPRNDLPRDYAPQEVFELLNARRKKLLCVRGNCDADVDQMVLDFPILADYAVIPVGDRLLYATHGHNFSDQTPPPLCSGDMLLCGHTHVSVCENKTTFTYLNPGSTSLPKQDTPHSYMTLEDGLFIWKEIETGCEYRRWSAK